MLMVINMLSPVEAPKQLLLQKQDSEPTQPVISQQHALIRKLSSVRKMPNLNAVNPFMRLIEED